MHNRIKSGIKKLAKKYLFFLVAFTAVICITLIYAMGKKPVYEASSKIRIVDTFGVSPSGDGILLKAAANLNLVERDNLSELPALMRKSLSVAQDPDSGLTIISMAGENPRELTRLVNEIANVYIGEINLQARKLEKETVDKKQQQLKEYKKDLMLQLAVAEKELEDCERRMEELSIEEERNTARLVSLKARLAELEFEKANLLRVFTSAHPDVIRLQSDITSLQETINVLPPESKGRLRLERELNDKRKVYATLKERWDEVNLKSMEGMRGAKEDSTVISYAEKPSFIADLLDRKAVLLKGSIAAFIIAFLTAFIAVFSDSSIVSHEELAACSKLPVVAGIPYIRPRPLKGTRLKDATNLILAYGNNPAIIEPYRMLYAYVQSNIFADRPEGKSVLFTSSVEGEGKTVNAANLALTIAKKGKKVILIDANISNPSLHELLGLGMRMPGFTDVLNKGAELDDAIRGASDILLGEIGLKAVLEFKGLDKLSLITIGSPVSDLGELLRSDAVDALISKLKRQFDYIIIDGPSIAASTDSLSLISKCDVSLLVYLAGKTPKSSLKSALLYQQQTITPEAAGGSEPKIRGVILNACI